MILQFRLTLIFFLTTFFLSVAQEDFRFNNKSISDGLSQSYVSCIVQDGVNSLWIGTQDGLNRYDGSSFEVFSTRNTKGLSSQHITCSLKAKNGDLWFGTNNGVTKYSVDLEVFETFVPSVFVSAISFDGNKTLWISTQNNGVLTLDIESGKETKITELSGGSYSAIFAVSEDSILITSPRSGLKLLVNEKVSVVNSDPFINQIRRTSNGKIVVCSKSKVLIYDNGDCSLLLDGAIGGKVIGFEDVSYNSDLGWLFCTENNGLLRLDPQGDIQFYKNDLLKPSSLLNNSLNCFWTDNYGYLWIGSNRGISSFDPSHVGFLSVGLSASRKKGLPDPNVWCFNENFQGDLMVGTSRGISIQDKESKEFSHYLFDESSHSIVLSIANISANEYLVSTSDALYTLKITGKNFNYSKVRFPTEKKALVHRRFYKILRLNTAEFLVGTSGGAIIYNVLNKQITFFEHDPSNQSNTISKGVCRFVFKDSKGQIWLSTSSGGLNLLTAKNGTREIIPFEKNSFIKKHIPNYISSIYEAPNGKYFFSTNGSGVFSWGFKSDNLTRYTSENGLPNDVVYGILSDDKNTLWVSTNQGLASIDHKKNIVNSYSEKNGLSTNEYNLGAYFKAKDKNELFFGGINGYNYFDPNQLNKTNENLSVVFTKLKVQNDFIHPKEKSRILELPIYKTKELNLGYRKRDFTLFFQSSKVSNSNLIQYKYSLSGPLTEEVFLGSDNSIRFNALAPGEYQLEVYARVGEGKWCTLPAVLSIKIVAPLWQKWWFWLVVLTVLGFFVWWFIRQRMWTREREKKFLEKKIQLRTKKIQEKNRQIEQQKKVIEAEKNKVLDQQKELEKQKIKTEQLLKSAIPEFFVEKLLNQKRTSLTARAYKMVSIMFTDFVGFTKAAENLTPTELVKKLDSYFKKIDQIILKHNLERIKTIGDSYMCAGGLPVRNKSNPIDTCLAALEIQAYMEKRKNDAIANGREYWELRIGINTGNVTGGVIGTERLAFDVWGASVNRARRMEETGIPGKVCISDRTYEHVASFFDCTEIGKVDSKGRDKIKQYVIDGIKPELCKRDGITPNARFYEILNLHLYSNIQYQKAEFHIMKELQEKLPENLYYHSIKHTKDVVEAVERIALSENVTDEGLFLLKSAANYHDAGFTEQYSHNEPIGASMAERILPHYGYSDKHIQRIKELIFVTAIPHQPKDLWEEIICDADLDYLGRDDFHEIADTLYRELKDRDIVPNKKAWDELQVKFLTAHKYFTKTSIKTRKAKKAENLAEIKQRLKEGNYSSE